MPPVVLFALVITFITVAFVSFNYGKNQGVVNGAQYRDDIRELREKVREQTIAIGVLRRIAGGETGAPEIEAQLALDELDRD